MFQLRVDTVLGITMNRCSVSRKSPNACCPALGLPGRSQLALGTEVGSTTWTPLASVIITAVSTCGSVSSVPKPLWTATSRMAVAGSSEQ
jgi:hypothetical protein